MIRINLLAVERQRAKKKVSFQIGQKLTIACSLILVLGALFIGWRYWSLSHESASLDAEIAKAQRETASLQTTIQQVQQFDQRKAQLQERVGLIEQLRKGQSGPVHMLDQISRALPPMLWLTELKQKDSDIVIDGSCTNLNSLSDFVANLEASGYFKRPIEIVNTQSDNVQQAQGELVKFSIRAQAMQVADPKVPAAAPAKAGG
jgi:type IV pilus assembly protein PilN